MIISAHELQAFRILAQKLNFSTAAASIHITQSALSQRIQSLERSLGLTLFIRDRKAIKLTEGGIRLLRYCQTKDHLEAELLNDLVAPADGKLAGHLRVAGFSSVLHSVVMPALAPLLRDNPAVQFEFSMHEMSHLPDVLMRGEADFVVMDHAHQKDNVRHHILGHERYVLIQSTRFAVSNTYLDHDPNDKFTKLFFKSQGKHHQHLIRSYVDDIEGIIHGVMNGIGQGVVPSHLLKKEYPVRIVDTFKTMKTPVVLNYFSQPYYSKLQHTVIDALKNNCSTHLSQ